MKQRCPVGGGYCTTLTASGMTGHGHCFGEPNIRLSGTVRPWSTSILLHSVRSNSSRITDCAICGGKLGMALHHRHRPRAPALVGDREFGGGAERKGRDHLDRERRGVVVVDHDADVRLGLRHPFLGALEALEHALPVRLAGAVIVDRGADRRHVRRRHSCDDPSHGASFPCCDFGLAALTMLDPAFSYLPDSTAVAVDRAAAAQHHVGVVLLGRAGHQRGEMLERMAVGRPELGGEIDVAAQFQHPVVLALEDRLALLGRELRKSLVEIFRLVRP